MGVRVTVNWLGPSRSEMGRMADFLEKEAGRVKAEADRLLSTPGPPRSAPGGPPHMDSGDTRRGLYARVDRDGLSAEVGSDTPQAHYTEVGTRTMAPRPWLSVALRNAKR